ncbi:MAG: cysteine--tRNA ligase [Candidatus Levybacteria bacterium RIFCSPLOWO2_12_FULL_37_14]|nr:MAG: cysteine--tRNA ligase [Candidatus Levybacteria bacterium RIFCSPLOWO2_12_FULL_37_14]
MHLYNSLVRKKELFIPLNKNTVTLYVCGITPYDITHLGHAFTYLSFDILVRYLKYLGFKVIYAQNVTDINDRDKDILERAKQQNIPWKKLAEVSTKKFLEDMRHLNWIMPTNYLKASESINSVIFFIKKLLANGFAYEVKGSVYLNIDKDRQYGKLSRLTQEKMLEIAKNFDEDLDNPDKKNSLDVTLWRAATPDQPEHIPSFASSFGKGRPGWHMECSAMSMSTLGEQIDIHGGGIDLLFPHHEAEIAQSEGATGKKPFVRYWMHTGNIFYRGEKMSKSKGNLVLVSSLLQKYTANALRWLLFSHHYRESWEFKEKELDKAEQTFARLAKLISQKRSSADNKILWQMFANAMNDNLDTPKTLLLIKNAAEKGDLHFAKTALQKLGFLL